MEEHRASPELESIFANLGREIHRPLDALRDGIEALLDDPARLVEETDRTQAATLLALCDDLRQLTDDCLECPGNAATG